MNMNLLLDAFDDFEDMAKFSSIFTIIIIFISTAVFVGLFTFVIFKVVKHATNAQEKSLPREILQEKPMEQVKTPEPKRITTYCDYCGGIMKESDRACPSCGAKRSKIE